MDIFQKYPDLAIALEQLCPKRRNEILQDMVENDNEYNILRRARTKTSMLLRDVLLDKCTLLDEYSNTVYSQECYELDALYRQGFIDALKELVERGLL